MTRTSLFASRKESDRIQFIRHISRERVHGAESDLSKVRPKFIQRRFDP